MRLAEFADLETYTLSTDDWAQLANEIRQVWARYGVDVHAPLMLRILDPENPPKEVVRTKDNINQQSHRRH